MELTREIKEFLLNQGADLVGVAAAESLFGAPEGYRPNDYLPRARSVISFAYALNRGAVLALPKSRNEYMLEFEHANAFLNGLGHRGARFLERKGFTSIAFPATASIGDATRLKGDLSNKHAAVAGGLGLFGLNNLLLTPQFGCRVRLGAIVTEAELIPDKPLEENPCNLCGKCIKACPVDALQGWKNAYSPKEGWSMDKEKCYHYIFVQLAGKRCGMCIASCPVSNGKK
ncbi:MAG: epoxyqueuosine reductase [Thermoanaerobacteraceae bacterium]|nr:epoxyqueuosine reductase [Thermoanaerobacteraceae bacterium]